MSPDNSPQQPTIETSGSERDSHHTEWIVIDEEEKQRRISQIVPSLAKQLNESEEWVRDQIVIDSKKLIINGPMKNKRATAIAIMLTEKMVDEKKKNGENSFGAFTSSIGSRRRSGSISSEETIESAEVFGLHFKSKLIPGENGGLVRVPVSELLHREITKAAVESTRTVLDLLDSVVIPPYNT